MAYNESLSEIEKVLIKRNQTRRSSPKKQRESERGRLSVLFTWEDRSSRVSPGGYLRRQVAIRRERKKRKRKGPFRVSRKKAAIRKDSSAKAISKRKGEQGKKPLRHAQQNDMACKGLV